MSAHTLAFQIHNFVTGFGEYRSFLAPNCMYLTSPSLHPWQPCSLVYKYLHGVRTAVQQSCQADASGARPSYVFKALSRLPCSAFFTHRAWMMWKKNWAIPVCIVPMFVASAVCAIGVTVVYDSLPLPIIGQKLVWAVVCLSSSRPNNVPEHHEMVGS